jgi:hypothetical protein
VTATTLPRDHTPVVPALSERDRAYNGVFTTALEGGIGYWSTCSRYHWSVEGSEGRTEALDFIAVIHDTVDAEDGHTPTYVIDRSVIAKGIRKAHARGNWNEYQGKALADLTFGRWEDLDYDAITADLIVQFGLFGEEMYG